MNVLVTGSNGQLGKELRSLDGKYKHIRLYFTDIMEIDICNYEQLESFLKERKINSVINCAAFTSVENAEINSKKANKINFDGVVNIVNALNKLGGKLIHISTDYVFDGKNHIPYTEEDNTNPVGVYGKSKRMGELAIIDSGIDGIIIRTSWLYSAYGRNFVKTMLELGSKNNSIDVVYDQTGTPTYARDLAITCLKILSQTMNKNIKKNGYLYHYSNEGVASWYDLAHSTFEISGLNCKIKPVCTKDFPTLAKRPEYSVLNKSKIKSDFNIEIPHWRDSLIDCIKEIKINT